jgi:hypothetical protein
MNLLPPQECFKIEPLELLDKLKSDMMFPIPPNVNSRENRLIAAQTITKATAYESYCAEMETRAKLLKKAAKAAKQTEEYNRMMSYEDIFKTLKEISKQHIENVAKLMTLKRLELDEQRQNYNNQIT